MAAWVGAEQYAIKLVEDFPEGWQPWFINANDSSVEGIISTPGSGKQIWGAQSVPPPPSLPPRPSLFQRDDADRSGGGGCRFHPESFGGPLDTIEMFEDFLVACRADKAKKLGGGSGVGGAEAMLAKEDVSGVAARA